MIRLNIPGIRNCLTSFNSPHYRGWVMFNLDVFRGLNLFRVLGFEVICVAIETGDRYRSKSRQHNLQSLEVVKVI